MEKEKIGFIEERNRLREIVDEIDLDIDPYLVSRLALLKSIDKRI